MMIMEQNKMKSKLFPFTIIDSKDELDEKLEKCFSQYQHITNKKSDREASDALQAYTHKGQNQHEEIQLGLFFSILSEPASAQKRFRDLTLTSKDGLAKVLHITNKIIHEKWPKLQDTARQQLIWFTRELVKSAAQGADSVIHSLIRQVAGGDVSPKNIWLTESVLDILAENRAWLDQFPVLLAISVYMFLRVIVDHGNSMYAALRQREVDFCISIIRERWSEIQTIGRDLVRLLQDVAKIPVFEALWKDILFTPSNVHPQFKGLEQLMRTRTSKKFFLSRLTPDMENKLSFLTTRVKFGQQKRYQDWFQKQYLSTPESQSLRCDLIRYICAVIHPTNEILCSDIMPRWAVIGWLLTTCTTNVVASNAKLALFYDWMFFEPDRDSIMNIEPCVLVMFHSIRPHPAITVTLLDFMCRIMPNFYPPLAAEVKKGIFTALRTIVEKKVLQSLAPLFDNAKLDKELRSMIKEHFSEFCASDLKDDGAISSSTTNKARVGGAGIGDYGQTDLENTPYLPVPEAHSGAFTGVAEFSDDEEESAIIADTTKDAIHKDEVHFRPIKEPVKFQSIDISEYVEQLYGPIKEAVIDLQSETENELQCEMMDRLVQAVVHDDDFDQDQDMRCNLAICLTQLLVNQFNNNLFPLESDEEAIEDSIAAPLFVIFRNLCQRAEEDPSRQPILLLLEEMYNKQNRLGYHFLYFLKVSKMQAESKMSPYKDFCRNMEREIEDCMMADLRLCQEDDVRLFTYLIPDIYNQFPNIAVGNSDLLHLIVACIDGTQLQDLICEILQGHLIMFKKDSFVSILNSSLEWETIEQYFLWQLIFVHTIPVEYMMPVLPKLDYHAHAEALTNLMIQLKLKAPTAELLRPVLCRACKRTDMFTVSLLKCWAQEHEDTLAELIFGFIKKSDTGVSPPTRKRQRHGNKNKDKEPPSVDQILSHLEAFRVTCQNKSFLINEQMQSALQHVQNTCSDSFKSRYGDLLALAEDLDDLPSTRVLRAVPSRRASAAASKHQRPKSRGQQESSSESEQEDSGDEDVKPKSKKAKRSVILDDVY